MNYDMLADTYDSKYKSQESICENDRIKLLLSFYVREGSKVVDLGCGTGFCKECISKPIEYIGYDVSQNMIDIAEQKFPNEKFVLGSMKDVVETDIDVAISLFSIPYIDDGSLEELFGKIRSGGLFIGVYYNQPYLNEDSVYYGRYDEYISEVKPRVDDFIVKLRKLGDVLENDNLTNTKTYHYIVVKRR